jgi:hypothetical protein
MKPINKLLEYKYIIVQLLILLNTTNSVNYLLFLVKQCQNRLL